jgi:hypothetical protein
MRSSLAPNALVGHIHRSHLRGKVGGERCEKPIGIGHYSAAKTIVHRRVDAPVVGDPFNEPELGQQTLRQCGDHLVLERAAVDQAL